MTATTERTARRERRQRAVSLAGRLVRRYGPPHGSETRPGVRGPCLGKTPGSAVRLTLPRCRRRPSPADPPVTGGCVTMAGVSLVGRRGRSLPLDTRIGSVSF